MNRYRTIWRRLGAVVIDTLVMVPALWVGLTYYRYSYGTLIGVVWAVGMLVITTAYFIYFHGRYGQTIGKRVFKIRVVSARDESAIGFGTAAKRESPWMLFGILSALSLHWMKDTYPRASFASDQVQTIWNFADLIVVLLHPKRRALHDLIGGTVVVKEDDKELK